MTKLQRKKQKITLKKKTGLINDGDYREEQSWTDRRQVDARRATVVPWWLGGVDSWPQVT